MCLFNDSSSPAHVTWYGVEHENGWNDEVVRISKAVVVVYFEIVFQDSFYQQIGLKFKEETNKMLHLEHGFVWC